MGYGIALADQDFHMPACGHEDALAAIKAMRPTRRWGWPWVDEGEVRGATTLQKAMSAWRWEPLFDSKTWDIVGLEFTGEKSGDDEGLFKAIAPYVMDGSYLEIVGEGGGRWRYVFRRGECRRVEPKITWGE